MASEWLSRYDDGTTVFITGHRGYIGAALTHFMQALPCVKKVVGYDLSEGDDIMDLPRLIAKMAACQPEVVIHLAALSSVTACNDDPVEAMLVNARGTHHVLQAMAASGCKHIIYASTSSVYGDHPHMIPYRESMPTLPCSPYGVSKLWGEFAIINHYELQENPGNYLIMRMFNVVGTSGKRSIDRGANPGYDRLFGALQSGQVTIYGNDFATADGTCGRDYVALRDICRAYILGFYHLLTSEIQATLNLASGQPKSVLEVIAVWNRLHNQGAPLPRVTYRFGERRAGDPALVAGDPTAAEEIISWTAQIDLETLISNLGYDKRLLADD